MKWSRLRRLQKRKGASKKTVEEVDEGVENTESSFEFDDIFDVEYDAPLTRGHK